MIIMVSQITDSAVFSTAYPGIYQIMLQNSALLTGRKGNLLVTGEYMIPEHAQIYAGHIFTKTFSFMTHTEFDENTICAICGWD